MMRMWSKASPSLHTRAAVAGYYEQTVVTSKWLCVVAKYEEEDAFVITAYLTDKPKEGEILWPTD